MKQIFLTAVIAIGLTACNSANNGKAPVADSVKTVKADTAKAAAALVAPVVAPVTPPVEIAKLK